MGLIRLKKALHLKYLITQKNKISTENNAVPVIFLKRIDDEKNHKCTKRDAAIKAASVFKPQPKLRCLISNSHAAIAIHGGFGTNARFPNGGYTLVLPSSHAGIRNACS